MTEIRTCVNCKHIGGPDAEVYYPHPFQNQFGGAQVNRGPECRNEKAATLDPVYGKAYCIAERQSKKGCGKQGKLWETKNA